MPRLLFLPLLLVALVALLTGGATPATGEPEQAIGFVFHDRDGNGVRDPGEEGIAGVLVSNQREIVATDEEGRWRLSVEDDDTIFFVIKPTGWMTALDHNNLPQFYYIHKPHGSPYLHYRGVSPTGPLPESIDFPLYPQEEPERFEAIMAGDPQPRNIREVNYLTRDVVPELAQTPAAFGVSMGDIVSNNLDMFEPLNDAFGGAGIPWYNVVGNHDLNFDARDPRHATETFHRVYGPDYYSFNYGNVHFLALNNNRLVPMRGDQIYNYDAGLGSRQMDFVRNNLALVPKDRLVVVMMHIPFLNNRWRAYQEEVLELYQLLASRPHAISLAGHMHTQHLRVVERRHGWPGKEPHLNYVLGTIGGSWWRGTPDELGVPHALMFDGTARGYNIFTFDGAGGHSFRFKAMRRPADYQMNVWTPDEVRQDEAGATEVFANVFAGTQFSTVEMRLGNEGEWHPMAQTSEPDPIVLEAQEREMGMNMLPYRPISAATNSTHLWKATLPEFPGLGGQTLQVRSTDMFGQVHHGERRFRVELGITPAQDRALFHPAKDGIVLRFGSVSGVERGDIRLRINDEDRSEELVIDGDPHRFEARFEGLEPGRLYEAVVEVTERNGRKHIRPLRFDTFDPESFMWEAVDYNFDGGKFIDNPPLEAGIRPNYRYKSGVQGVDKNEINRAGENSYRLFDNVGTERVTHALRPHLVEKGLHDYGVGWLAEGEWMNYTRTFPPGRFHVYGKFGYGRMNGFTAQLSRVTSDPSKPNQTLEKLGTFSKRTGTDNWDDYQYLPLRDEAGDLAEIELDGVDTLRLTSGVFNVNYFILVPVRP